MGQLSRTLVLLRRSVMCALALMFAASAIAQDVSVAGSVADESKAILPGVVVTATEVSSGRTYEAITDGRGQYRLLGLGAGQYEIKAVLSGFATTVLSNLQFLVGQNATVDIVLKVATVQESVTVTGASPLVDYSNAQIAGNVDPRQMQSLPLSGRNWLDLSANVAGLTTFVNSTGTFNFGRFQINLDGQQITQDTSVTSFGQPGISQDAIAEYQVSSTPYDVSTGRSVGAQVEAISKSGSNTRAGSLYGYFRGSQLNSANPFTGVVLPYQDQQFGGTIGGPIVRDKTHFFVSYEQEHNPNTVSSHPTALSPQQITLDTRNNLYKALGRIDHQLSNNDHFVIRGNYYTDLIPFNYSNPLVDPSRATKYDVTSYAFTTNWTHTASNGTLQQVRVGYYRYYWHYGPVDGAIQTPEYNFPGLTIGLNWNYPEFIRQANLPIRYDLTKHAGNHDVKIGGEWLVGLDDGDWPQRSHGQWFFSTTPQDAPTRFSLYQDPSHWNFAGLDPTAIRFDITYANDYLYNVPRKSYAVWLGDTWRVNARVTVNAGVRYDLNTGEFAPPNVQDRDIIINNGLYTVNAGYRTGIRDTNNVAPRLGIVWNAGKTNDLVIRAGTGMFYSGVGANPAFDMQLSQHIIFNSYANDGRPGFIADPTRGVTASQVLSGAAPLAPQSVAVIDPNIQTPRTWQTTLGFQKQFNVVTGLEANLVYLRGYHQETVHDPNLFYDPASGFPKNPVTFGRPNPAYGPVRLIGTDGWARSLILPATFTRRYSNNFQLSVIYTHVFFDENAGVGGSGYGNDLINPFDVNYNYGYAGTAKNILRSNGVWNLPAGLVLSGVFQFSSGDYATYSSGLSPLGGYGANRLRRDLSFIPKNTFHNDRGMQVDMRISKDFHLTSGVKLTGIAEVFNLFKNTINVYDLRENSATYLQVTNIVGLNGTQGIRTGQLAFRMSF